MSDLVGNPEDWFSCVAAQRDVFCHARVLFRALILIPVFQLGTALIQSKKVASQN